MPRSRRAIALALAILLIGAAAVVFAAVDHKGKSRSGGPGGSDTTVPALPGGLGPIPGLRGDQVGLSTGVQLFSSDVSTIDTDMAGMAAIHAHWVRTAVRWDLVEPNSPGSDDWTKVDHIVDDAETHGLSLILNLTGTPKWARSADATTNVEFPPDLHTYATFAQKIAARYKGRVAAYELGNEPNHKKTFAKPDPALYVQVLKLSYPLIKAADPHAEVLTGGLGGNKDTGGVVPGDVYLADLYKAGAKGYFDGVSFHPYTYPDLPSKDSAKPGWTRMLAARQTMVDNGDGAKQIWVTEYGAPTGGPGSVSEAQQAAMMHDAYRLWSTYPWAGPLCWFDYRDKGTDPSDHGNFFGLYTKDSKPKVALQQYETLVAVS